jgi:hypothetical protein
MTDKTMTLEEARAILGMHLVWLTHEQHEWALTDPAKSRREALRLLLASEASAVAKVSALQAERDEARQSVDEKATEIGLTFRSEPVAQHLAYRAAFLLEMLHQDLTASRAEVSRMREALEKARRSLDSTAKHLDSYGMDATAADIRGYITYIGTALEGA